MKAASQYHNTQGNVDMAEKLSLSHSLSLPGPASKSFGVNSRSLHTLPSVHIPLEADG